ncbi:MAG TPA: 3-oxoacyl-ACP synthase, partial [Gemmatimonadales bacterium]|nr:3-oxoacyl-ACP synthase [Gemmatimonadales bacterium]
MSRSRIIGTGFHVPDQVVRNDDLAKLMDTTDEWIRTRTGIQERHWVREGESGAEMAKEAADRALEMAGLRATDLDAIIYATSTPDHYVPGGGVFLQRLMGVPAIPAMDVHQACSGFV